MFGVGQALYFASQGTGQMLLPVTVSFLRFVLIRFVGVVAINFLWSLQVVFAGVSAGLIIIGIGMSLCFFGPDWRSKIIT